MILNLEPRTGEGLSTRDRILKAAREVFERNGTRGTTTREIAERAGVNEATIFRQFGNKTALLDAMRESSCGSVLGGVMDRMTGDLEADLCVICETMYDGIRRNRAIIKIGLAEEATDPDQLEPSWRGPRQILDTVVAFLQEHIDAGRIHGNARQLALMIMGMMFALAIKSDRLWRGEEWRPEAMIPAFVNVTLNGIRN